ncbi:hypothetical protein NUW54_g13411 [Trametes sanguinea]|uniref:Uncharacterized protein n=1 Tax=Trametes sanguinea TaxID=158606 RepID=A0ACC1MNH5_9APHY|nr:hypothetical protein NUW54_g13411 [Trametes sanguinea]
MIARTPRPRRKSSATFGSPILRARSNAGMAVPSSWKGLNAKEKEKGTGAGAGDNESVISDYGTLLKDDDSDFERQLEGDGSESDSSIDIHTPLPHLMFRDGLLSPRSKLLPAGTATLSLYMDDSPEGQRANSVLSVVSTGEPYPMSGVYRDPRDTQRRRRRHKDQTLLRAGMGLTTGLGWSDSEDEDAPSLLTRRLISTSLARQPTITNTVSRAPSQLTKSTSVGNLSHPPPSYSPISRPGTRTLSRLSAILILPALGDDSSPIRLIHLSFTNFIVDPSRCTDPAFLVTPVIHHTLLATHCLRILGTLRHNICEVDPKDQHLLNSEIPELQDKIARHLPPERQYAAKYWAHHLHHAKFEQQLLELLESFSNDHLLDWIEALSLLGCVHMAIEALQSAQQLLKVSKCMSIEPFHVTT